MNKLPPEAIHLSFEAGPHRMAMGLTACPWADWLELDELYVAEMAERRRLLDAEREEVLIVLPGSEAACRETLAQLAAHLPAQYPSWFAREGALLHNRLTGECWDLADAEADPLELAGRLVQEDLCIIQPTEDGPLLVAGLVCFPSRWQLRDKIGRPLAVVHGPVPFYQEKLARPVDRFMGVVKPGHVAVRLNWSLMDDPTLFQPTGKFRTDRNESITPENAGKALYVRVERQTLTRLPETGAVLFTIRVHVYPLALLAGRAEIAARLAGAVRALPTETMHYKSLFRFRPALLAYLDRQAGECSCNPCDAEAS